MTCEVVEPHLFEQFIFSPGLENVGRGNGLPQQAQFAILTFRFFPPLLIGSKNSPGPRTTLEMFVALLLQDLEQNRPLSLPRSDTFFANKAPHPSQFFQVAL